MSGRQNPTAVVWQEAGWFVAQCLELDFASQGNSLAEAKENLIEALTLSQQAPVADVPLGVPDSLHQLSGCQPVTLSGVDWDERSGRAGSEAFEQCGIWTFRKLRFQLEYLGFEEVFQLGNHAKFVARDPVRTCILPHYRELAAGVVSSILRQSRLGHEVLAAR